MFLYGNLKVVNFMNDEIFRLSLIDVMNEGLLNDFVNDNFKLKQELFVVIHGIGSGILKDTTIKTLKTNKLVKEFQIDFYNVGSTIVRLNI